MIELKYNDDGLIPAIIQDDQTGEVLMMAWMNEEAVRSTLTTGKTTFYSRSRKKMWIKGEESGHVQTVKSVAADCDRDTLLVRVDQVGGACHDGYRSCFYTQFDKDDNTEIVGEKVFEPKEVYKTRGKGTKGQGGKGARGQRDKGTA